MDQKNILCFGDSNTHGYNSKTGGRFTVEERWTKLLQRKLGDDYYVIEEGLSGRTTSFEDPVFEGLSGLNAIYPCMMTHEPLDLVIIMLGTNDTKERFGASSACIALGLKRLIEKARSISDCWRNGPNILIVTPKNIDPEYAGSSVGNTMGRGCAEKSAGLGSEYEKIALLTGCRYFDANTVVTENNHIDFMHLTAQGHRELAEALAKQIPCLIP